METILSLASVEEWLGSRATVQKYPKRMDRIDPEPSSSLELKVLKCQLELEALAQLVKSALVPYRTNNSVLELSKAKKG